MSQLITLAAAIEISYKMLAAVEDSNLDAVDALDRDRKILIDQYFDQPADYIDPEQTLLLRQINDDIVKRLSLKQSEIRHQHATLMRGNKASKAYLNHQSR